MRAASCTDARRELRRQQRVTTKCEEIVISGYRLVLKHRGHMLAKFLYRIRRCLVRSSLPPRHRWQGLAVDFSTTQQRQLFVPTHLLRQHEFRQPTRQCATDFAQSKRSAIHPCGQMGDQSHIFLSELFRHHDGLSYPIDLLQCSFDFAQLDTVSATRYGIRAV